MTTGKPKWLIYRGSTPRTVEVGLALQAGERPVVICAGQSVCDELTRLLKVPPVRLIVGDVRPSNRRGELHGLYTPGRAGERDSIQVWMTTAKRGQVVAFKTFLRTLVHEICHHLDYQLLGLAESLHTEGFFRRESSIVRQLLRLAEARPPV